MPGQRPDVARLLSEAARAHAAVTARTSGGATVWEAAAGPFAALSGGAAEFRLRPDMVRAAVRTPAARSSDRGPDWVAFDTPAELDRYDVDRLRSWFEMAARLAGG